MYSTIIIDDEIDARTNIRSFAEKFCPELQFVGEADSVKKGIEIIEELKPQLIFLDIKLGDGTGFNLLERVAYKGFKVIFVTAYDEFAIKAIKVKALDYLLKPLNKTDLVEAVQQAVQSISSANEVEMLKATIANFEVKKMGFPTGKGIQLSKITDIVRLEADGNYTRIYLKSNESILVAKTLKIFEDTLIEASFIRVHQSHLVNVHVIDFFDTKQNILKLMDSDVLIPVSRRNKSNLVNIINMKIT